LHGTNLHEIIGQAGANVYGELLQSLDTTMYILDMYDSDDDEEDSEITQLFVDALLNIAQHESGLPATRESLLERCREAVTAIEAVVSSSYHVDDDYDKMESSLDVISDDEYIPIEFFERNERTWRGRVQQDVAENAYRRVHDAAQKLRQAVKEDFIGSSESNKSLLKYNFFDNLIGLNKIPGEGFENEISFIHPSDRIGKVILNRWSTEKVKQAVSCYVTECENATAEVASILSALAQNLQDEGHIPAIVQSSHLNLILSTAFHHAVKATNSKWELANTIEDSPPTSSINNEKNQQIVGHQPSSAEAHFVDVFPYWMHRSKAVSNTFDLSSMILLTAPNMSGKSTLMRSTAAAALLTVCGLCGPLSSESRISRFDTLFLRGASADIPTEDKSAFGAEMGDLAALFRCSGPKSFVFVDELGRGTSPRDGTRLAGAVLERMADLGMSGIFATHLHDVLDLPLRKTRIVTKRIKIDRDEKNDSYVWTHKLEDGICTDSMALVTAKRFGLPAEIIRRAEELTQFIPERTNSTDKDSIGSLVVDPMDGDYENIFTSDGIIEDVFISSIPETSSSSSTTKNQLLKREQEKEHRRKEFSDVIDLASKLINDKTSSTAVQVPPRHHPPASLSNRSCLYVLQLTAPSSSSTTSSSSTSTSRYYVGETDSLSKRLSQHRRKGSGMWSHSKAVVFPVDDKTQARYLESTLIGELARAGYSLESIADGRTLRHFRD
jgi:hypothetical protein